MLYPIITDSRGIIELNGIWNFKLDKGEGFNEKWYENARCWFTFELYGYDARWRGKEKYVEIMMTEYGADTLAGLHDIDPVMFTEEFQVEYLRANHEVFDEFDHFIGKRLQTVHH
ncbi:hypothetical protein ACP8HI_03155 [Paenibacillus sp. FA6]|uniref:hypothetical protein n=1 Tax=Paenibacillus sp. FA6 TaxID=3413029 RepID=UPI003F65863F